MLFNVFFKNITSEIAERYTCNKNSMYLLYNTVTIFIVFVFMHLEIFDASLWLNIFILTILTKSDDLMSEFTDSIHHHELKEIRN